MWWQTRVRGKQGFGCPPRESRGQSRWIKLLFWLKGIYCPWRHGYKSKGWLTGRGIRHQHQFATWPRISRGNFFFFWRKACSMCAETGGDTFWREKGLLHKQQGAQSTGVNEAVLSGTWQWVSCGSAVSQHEGVVSPKRWKCIWDFANLCALTSSVHAGISGCPWWGEGSAIVTHSQHVRFSPSTGHKTFSKDRTKQMTDLREVIIMFI